MFNPDATLQAVVFDERRSCLVIDDALLEPERLVAHAAAHAADLRPVDFSVYPGVYLMAPAELAAALAELFRRRLRARFDARRCERLHCRLSMITLQPAMLRPYHWLCHVDDAELDASRESMPASVLYLFRDERLGGTSFYAPRRTADVTAALFKDARQLSAPAFTERYGIEPGYMHGDNDYFECIGRIPAKWNRLIFYDGGIAHSAAVAEPDRLSPDPTVGRLTLNGFFTCRRRLT
jgi:hypothetical protein